MPPAPPSIFLPLLPHPLPLLLCCYHPQCSYLISRLFMPPTPSPQTLADNRFFLSFLCLPAFRKENIILRHSPSVSLFLSLFLSHPISGTFVPHSGSLSTGVKSSWRFSAAIDLHPGRLFKPCQQMGLLIIAFIF